jgi:hypothetical protein
MLTLAAVLSGCSNSVLERPSHPQRTEAQLMAEMGDLHPSAKNIQTNEDLPICEKEGLQSRREGFFDHPTLGKHRDPDTKYLWTIDDRGVNIALELTPAATSRGYITHTNISRMARFAGEVWFISPHEVILNGHSGRFGDRARATNEQYEAALEYWELLGYKVTAVPLGQR